LLAQAGAMARASAASSQSPKDSSAAASAAAASAAAQFSQSVGGGLWPGQRAIQSCLYVSVGLPPLATSHDMAVCPTDCMSVRGPQQA
jgi:hypothetical protein